VSDALRIVDLGKIADRTVAHLVDMWDAAVKNGNPGYSRSAAIMLALRDRMDR
jgi:hypothetical protein